MANWQLQARVPGGYPRTGLQLHYDMETLTVDGKIKDLSGNGNHGTITGTLADVPGKYGRARDFPGNVSNVLSALDSPSLNVTDGLTLAAWVNADTMTAAAHHIIAKRDAGPAGPYEIWATTTAIQVLLTASDDTGATFSVPFSPPLGTYFHVALTWKSAGGAWAIYVNGALLGSGTALAGKVLKNTSDKLWVGAAGVTFTELWDGPIDEVFVYNRALSATEIADLMNQGWRTITFKTNLRLEDEINQIPQLSAKCWALSAAEREVLVQGNDLRALLDGVERWYGQVRVVEDDPMTSSRKVLGMDKAVLLRDQVWQGRRTLGVSAGEGYATPAGIVVQEVVESPNGRPEEGLALYLDMNARFLDSGVLKLRDLSGNGNHAKTTGGVWIGSEGRLGRGQTFATTSEQLEVTKPNPSLDITGALTIAVWFQPGIITPSATRAYIVCDKGGGVGTEGGYEFRVDQTSPLTTLAMTLKISNGATTQSSTSGEQTFTLGWQHIAVTFDPAAAGGSKVKMYLNGESVGTPADVTINPSINVLSFIAGLGSFSMDELVVYARALRPAEIRRLALADVSFPGGVLTDTFDVIRVSAEEEQRLAIVDTVAKLVQGEWFTDRTATDLDRFRMVKRRGSASVAEVYTHPSLTRVSQEIDRDVIRNDIEVLGAGDGASQLRSRSYHATLIRTTLSLPFDIGSTSSISVVDASRFPTSGIARVGQERFLYNGKDATHLGTTSRTRAYSGDGTFSMAAYDHSAGTEVFLETDLSLTPPVTYSTTNPQPLSSIAVNGLRQFRHVDRSINSQDVADRLAAAFVAQFKDPPETVGATVIADSLVARVGDRVELYRGTKTIPPTPTLRYNMATLLSDGQMEDLAGGGRHGTLTGTTQVPGKFGDARQFDGVDDKITASAFSPTGLNMTVAAWFKWETNPTPNYGGIHGGGNSWELRVQNDGKFSCTFYQAIGPDVFTSATSPLSYNDGQWHLACAVLRAGLAEIYVDGVLVAQDLTGPLVSLRSSTGIVVGQVASFFNGAIDDVLIYDRALSASEVADLYAAVPFANTPYRVMRQVFDRDRSEWKMDLGAARETGDFVVRELQQSVAKSESYTQGYAAAQTVSGASGFRYVIWTQDGTNVITTNVRSGEQILKGTDWAAQVNAVLALPGETEFSIHVDPRVPPSTSTIVINKSDVTLYCPKRATKFSSNPYVRRITTGGPDLAIHRVLIEGIHADEIDLHAEGNVFNWQQDLEGVTLRGCYTEDFGTAGRRGLRFTGAGDIEHITIEDHFAAVNASGTSEIDPRHFISFENTSLGTGHIEFRNFWGESAAGANYVSDIVYRGGGRTGPTVRFTGSFVHIGSFAGTNLGCHVMQTNVGTPTANAGPSNFHFISLHLECQAAAMDLFRINANAGGSSYFNVKVDFIDLTTSAFAYNWVNELATGFIGLIAGVCVGSGVIIFGYTSFGIGTITDPANFIVDIDKVHGWNPRGIVGITVGASPFVYTNNEGVDVVVYIWGGTVTLVERSVGRSVAAFTVVFNSTNVTVHLGPRESVRVTWNTTAPTMNADRK